MVLVHVDLCVSSAARWILAFSFTSPIPREYSQVWWFCAIVNLPDVRLGNPRGSSRLLCLSSWILNFICGYSGLLRLLVGDLGCLHSVTLAE